MTNFFLSSLSSTFLVVSVFTSVMHVTNAQSDEKTIGQCYVSRNFKRAGSLHNKIATEYGRRGSPGICNPPVEDANESCVDDWLLVSTVVDITKDVKMFDKTIDENFIKRVASETLERIEYTSSFVTLGETYCRTWFEDILNGGTTGPFNPTGPNTDCDYIQGIFKKLDSYNEKKFMDGNTKKVNRLFDKLDKKVALADISNRAEGLLRTIISVNKASNRYWMKVLDNEEDHLYEIAKDRDDPQKKAKWWKKDAIGAALGFAQGYFSTGGSIEGGIVGGICGGVVASLSK